MPYVLSFAPFALPGLFPTINVPLAYRQNKFPYNDFGNASKGHDFLEKALKEQFWSGSDEGFLLHKELDILNPKGETVCKLSSDLYAQGSSAILSSVYVYGHGRYPIYP